MPRPTNFVSMVRNLVRDQVQDAIQGLLGAVGGPKKRAKNGRRRRRRRRGPGTAAGVEEQDGLSRIIHRFPRPERETP